MVKMLIMVYGYSELMWIFTTAHNFVTKQTPILDKYCKPGVASTVVS